MKVLVDSVLTTYELRSVDVLQTLRTDKEVPSEGTLNIEGRYYGQGGANQPTGGGVRKGGGPDSANRLQTGRDRDDRIKDPLIKGRKR